MVWEELLVVMELLLDLRVEPTSFLKRECIDELMLDAGLAWARAQASAPRDQPDVTRKAGTKSKAQRRKDWTGWAGLDEEVAVRAVERRAGTGTGTGT